MSELCILIPTLGEILQHDVMNSVICANLPHVSQHTLHPLLLFMFQIPQYINI